MDQAQAAIVAPVSFHLASSLVDNMQWTVYRMRIRPSSRIASFFFERVANWKGGAG
jgi:hypothetical protein